MPCCCPDLTICCLEHEEDGLALLANTGQQGHDQLASFDRSPYNIDATTWIDSLGWIVICNVCISKWMGGLLGEYWTWDGYLDRGIG